MRCLQVLENVGPPRRLVGLIFGIATERVVLPGFDAGCNDVFAHGGGKERLGNSHYVCAQRMAGLPDGLLETEFSGPQIS